jgi:squalene-hopene/tetraprenyl-beta-curcumene cyclase
MNSPAFELQDTSVSGAQQAARRASARLVQEQKPDGHWCGLLTADTTMESDYILLELWLHPPGAGAWKPPTRARIERAAASILKRQLPDGGFSIYPGGPSDVSATVKAYTALKLAGADPAALAPRPGAYSRARRP